MALRFSVFCLLILIIICCWKTLQVSGNNITPDCCLRVSPTEISANRVKDYRLQTAENNCNINAVVFITKRNIRICSPPNKKWVQKLIEKLNIRKKKNARHHKKTY
uniref:C-C motif chemokine n=1 Tax=Geotrypetes seraphini TaxID=260995 RepID=A0A6P8QED5_GEOSA|nr:C-C motif chemokine 19 [Geotrypetes seraphini]